MYMHTYDYVYIILIYLQIFRYIYTHIIIYICMYSLIYGDSSIHDNTRCWWPHLLQTFFHPESPDWGHASWQAVHTAQWGYDYWGAVIRGSLFWVRSFWWIIITKKNRGKATSNNKTCSRVKQKQCVVFNILETCCSYFGRIFFLKTIGWFQGPRAQKPGPRCFRFWHFRIHPITEPTSSSFKLSDGVVYHVAESTWNFCPRKVLGMTWSVFF